MKGTFVRTGLFITIASLMLAGSANAQTAAPPAPASGPAPTTFVVRFKIKAGRNAEFERIMATLQSQLPASEPGNVYYDLYLPAVDSQTYVLIEHYRNADAVQAHGKDSNTQKMAAAIKDLLDGPPAAERLILVSSKP